MAPLSEQNTRHIYNTEPSVIRLPHCLPCFPLSHWPPGCSLSTNSTLESWFEKHFLPYFKNALPQNRCWSHLYTSSGLFSNVTFYDYPNILTLYTILCPFKKISILPSVLYVICYSTYHHLTHSVLIDLLLSDSLPWNGSFKVVELCFLFCFCFSLLIPRIQDRGP